MDDNIIILTLEYFTNWGFLLKFPILDILMLLFNRYKAEDFF